MIGRIWIRERKFMMGISAKCWVMYDSAICSHFHCKSPRCRLCVLPLVCVHCVSVSLSVLCLPAVGVSFTALGYLFNNECVLVCMYLYEMNKMPPEIYCVGLTLPCVRLSAYEHTHPGHALILSSWNSLKSSTQIWLVSELGRGICFPLPTCSLLWATARLLWL